MRVRWTTDAADDLKRICDYIAESRPASARKVAKTIVDGVGILELFPNRGRAGRVDATRELVRAKPRLAILFAGVSLCAARPARSDRSSAISVAARAARPAPRGILLLLDAVKILHGRRAEDDGLLVESTQSANGL